MPFRERVRTVVILTAALLLARVTGAAEPLERRWVYLQTNLQVPENVEQAGKLLKRAAAAGYDGVVLAGVKGAMYTTWKSDYRQLEAFAKAAWGAK